MAICAHTSGPRDKYRGSDLVLWLCASFRPVVLYDRSAPDSGHTSGYVGFHPLRFRTTLNCGRGVGRCEMAKLTHRRSSDHQSKGKMGSISGGVKHALRRKSDRDGSVGTNFNLHSHTPAVQLGQPIRLGASQLKQANEGQDSKAVSCGSSRKGLRKP